MYQPALRPDQITRFYHLKLQQRKLMTRLLRKAVDQYLQVRAGELGPLMREADATFGDRPARCQEQEEAAVRGERTARGL
jgi:hypothetical protein